MRAMILGAGLGSRLGNLTKDIPKPLLPVGNVELLKIILYQLKRIGIDEVIINTYYLADKMEEFIKVINLNPYAFPEVYIHYENKLSGSAGAIMKCKDFFDDKQRFLVVSGDILTERYTFEKTIQQYDGAANVCSVIVSKEDVSKFGVIVADKTGLVKEFQEKPEPSKAKSTLINAGIYSFDFEIFSYIQQAQNANKTDICDLAKDVFPLILSDEALYTHTVHTYWNDIGSIESYAQAQLDAKVYNIV